MRCNKKKLVWVGVGNNPDRPTDPFNEVINKPTRETKLKLVSIYINECPGGFISLIPCTLPGKFSRESLPCLTEFCQNKSSELSHNKFFFCLETRFVLTFSLSHSPPSLSLVQKCKKRRTDLLEAQKCASPT